MWLDTLKSATPDQKLELAKHLKNLRAQLDTTHPKNIAASIESGGLPDVGPTEKGEKLTEPPEILHFDFGKDVGHFDQILEFWPKPWTISLNFGQNREPNPWIGAKPGFKSLDLEQNHGQNTWIWTKTMDQIFDFG